MNLFSANPTPFDLRWRMFGIPIRVHPSFWLFSWAFSYLYRPALAPNIAWQYMFLFIGVMFFAVLWREIGRALVARSFGHRGQIVLAGMGGQVVGEFERARRWQRIVIHLAGPAAGFLLWYLTHLFKFHLQWRMFPVPNPIVTRGVDLLLFEAFLWNLMNLLPVIPLDGGQAMREVVSGIFRKKGPILALLLSMTFAGLIAGYSGQLAEWAANNLGSYFAILLHLSPFVTAIFFCIYALMNLFSLIGEVMAGPKEPAPAVDEFAEATRNDQGAGDYPR